MTQRFKLTTGDTFGDTRIAVEGRELTQVMAVTFTMDGTTHVPEVLLKLQPHNNFEIDLEKAIVTIDEIDFNVLLRKRKHSKKPEREGSIWELHKKLTAYYHGDDIAERLR